MSEMINHVAIKLCESTNTYDAEACGDDPCQRCKDMARAAIEAMREPTQAMVKAAYDAGATEFPDDGEKCWPAMIDEALK